MTELVTLVYNILPCIVYQFYDLTLVLYTNKRLRMSSKIFKFIVCLRFDFTICTFNAWKWYAYIKDMIKQTMLIVFRMNELSQHSRLVN